MRDAVGAERTARPARHLVLSVVLPNSSAALMPRSVASGTSTHNSCGGFVDEAPKHNQLE